MGVQRAKPIDLSAGNEPFYINGRRGGRTRARCFCSSVGVWHWLDLTWFPSHYTDDNHLMVDVGGLST